VAARQPLYATRGIEDGRLTRPRLSRFQAAGRFFWNPLGENAFTEFIIRERHVTKGLSLWKNLVLGSKFPSLPRPSQAFRRAICRRFRQAKFPFPIQRRRRSKIPATRRFRLLPILT